jgi:hypothetical protein
MQGPRHSVGCANLVMGVCAKLNRFRQPANGGCFCPDPAAPVLRRMDNLRSQTILQRQFFKGGSSVWAQLIQLRRLPGLPRSPGPWRRQPPQKPGSDQARAVAVATPRRTDLFHVARHLGRNRVDDACHVGNEGGYIEFPADDGLDRIEVAGPSFRMFTEFISANFRTFVSSTS